MDDLLKKKVSHLTGDKKLLDQSSVNTYLQSLAGWSIRKIDEEHALHKSFKLKDFSSSIEFAKKICDIANSNDHHPRLVVNWGKLDVYWWSHDMGGINTNDIIMAAQTENIYNKT